MFELTKAVGTRYIHVLQPNQWFDEAGSYSPINGNHIYGWVIDPVNNGYRELRAEAETLAASGVNFLDGSLIFTGTPERTVYVDDCCHYTPSGYHVIFDAVATNLKNVVDAE